MSAVTRIALGNILESLQLIEEQAASFDHLIALGGDHTVTLPLLRAAANRLGAPLALVHFDAHVDTWPENFGQRYAHGSVFFHAIKEQLIDPQRTVQIGVRSPVAKEIYDWTVQRVFRSSLPKAFTNSVLEPSRNAWQPSLATRRFISV